MRKVLLVEPDYYTKFPPLGLLKLAAYHRSLGHEVRLVRGRVDLNGFVPDLIEITSLFTYAWKPVHDSIRYHRSLFKDAAIRVGGIYASLMPGNITAEFPDVVVHEGILEETEGLLPAYDLLETVEKWRDWDASILFTSRGCSRNCPFCVVPKIEGPLRSVADNVRRLVNPDHKRVILWDNNLLASPDWKKVLGIFEEMGVEIDFNQGLDARLITDDVAATLSTARTRIIRMAYDVPNEKKAVARAVDLLASQGFRKRMMLFYVLHNFYDSRTRRGDTPEEFLERLRYVGDLGCSSYPMRFVPPDALDKSAFVSPLWTPRRLEMVAKARRVLGYGGTFPPYEGLVKKFREARSFDEAFALRPVTGAN